MYDLGVKPQYSGAILQTLTRLSVSAAYHKLPPWYVPPSFGMHPLSHMSDELDVSFPGSRRRKPVWRRANVMDRDSRVIFAVCLPVMSTKDVPVGGCFVGGEDEVGADSGLAEASEKVPRL